MLKMKRCEFITLIGGAAAWPLAARAQQRERMRRIGALMNLTADDPEASARVTALAQGLQQLGWTVGRNLQIDYRWGAGDADRSRRYAAELVALVPDVILRRGQRRACCGSEATQQSPPIRGRRPARLERDCGHSTCHGRGSGGRRQFQESAFGFPDLHHCQRLGHGNGFTNLAIPVTTAT